MRLTGRELQFREGGGRDFTSHRKDSFSSKSVRLTIRSCNENIYDVLARRITAMKPRRARLSARWILRTWRVRAGNFCVKEWGFKRLTARTWKCSGRLDAVLSVDLSLRGAIPRSFMVAAGEKSIVARHVFVYAWYTLSLNERDMIAFCRAILIFFLTSAFFFIDVLSLAIRVIHIQVAFKSYWNPDRCYFNDRRCTYRYLSLTYNISIFQ